METSTLCMSLLDVNPNFNIFYSGLIQLETISKHMVCFHGDFRNTIDKKVIKGFTLFLMAKW